MINKIVSVLYPPFSVSEVDPFMIVDKQGTRIASAVDPIVAETIVELMNAGSALSGSTISNTYEIEFMDQVHSELN